MKTLLFILFLNYFPHEVQEVPDSYVKVVYVNGDSWINIRQENNKVKTLSFNNFIKAEPVITNPEGFILASELGSWNDSMRMFSHFWNKQINLEALNAIINVYSQHLYKQDLESMSREESLVLWVKITRAIFFHEFKQTSLRFGEKSKEASLIGEMIWPIMLARNPEICDIRIFSLHEPGNFSVNLLLDMSGNIMTKITLIPDVYYKEDFSISLLNKNSKALKRFALCSKERR